MAPGYFENAHDFVLNGSLIENLTIGTQNNITSNPNYEPLSPIRETAPCTSQMFTGQEGYLEKLHKYFECTTGAEALKRKLFLLYGMGGIGKTQICLKFKDDVSDQFPHVFWVEARSEDTVKQSLKDIYKILAGHEASKDSFSPAAALYLISSLKSEWLIIFDNADGSPEIVEKFLPPGNKGNILITSRNPAHKRITTARNSIEVAEMNEASAIELLLKASGLQNNSESYHELAKEIVNKLHFLPLAIDQAGAYITAGKCRMDNFIRVYNKHRPKLMNNKTFRGASKYEKTVYGTWEISCQKIIEMSNDKDEDNAVAAKYAVKLINICAFIHHDNISEEMFERAANNYLNTVKTWKDSEIETYISDMDPVLLNVDKDGEWDELLFGESIEILLSFSLIKRMVSKSTYRFHPLVQTWCQDRLKEDERKSWVMCSRGIIASSISNDETRKDYIYEQSIILHVIESLAHDRDEDQVVFYGDIFQIIAEILKRSGKYDLEERIRLKIKNKYQLVFGNESSHTLFSMDNLALSYMNEGKLAEAEQLNLQIIEIRTRVQGGNHPATLNSMSNLASTYRIKGKWSESEQLNLLVMEMSTSTLGKEHSHTLTTMNNLALIYMNQGRWAEAEKLNLQMVEMRTKILGKEHLDTLISMSNLALTYQNQGKWMEAEQLNLLAMEMMTKNLGKENPHTLTSMSNMALIYQNQENWTEAEKLNLQVMETRTRILGRDHPETLTSINNLTLLCMDQGKWTEAEQLNLQVMETRTRILGKEHPDTLISMGNLALTYQNQGKWAEAEHLNLQVMELMKRNMGREHPYTLTSMSNLASTFLNQGKWIKAEQLNLQVMEMRTRILGKEHPDTLISMTNLALAYQNQGKLTEAEQLMVRVHDKQELNLLTSIVDLSLTTGFPDDGN